MKFYGLTFIVLLNILILISASLQNETGDDKRECPDDQSSFTKHDLYLMVKDVSDGFNILPNITDYIHDVASNASHAMLLDFQKFKTDLELRPSHLTDVLDSMEDIRTKDIVPLVKVAATELLEFSKAEDQFNVLYSNATKMLRNLEQYKQLCILNNCPTAQLQKTSQVPLKSNHLTGSTRQEVVALSSSVSQSTLAADSEYICTTIEAVRKAVHEQLLSYELRAIEEIKKYLPKDNILITEELSKLKKLLEEAIQKQFGITMYDIISLDGDYFHFMNKLTDFNSKSYTSALKKNSVTVQYKLQDLADKIEKYRQKCLTCKQSRASFGKNVQAVTDNKNLLNETINDKINEIAHGVEAYIKDMYKKVDDIINDKNYVEEIMSRLEPLEENVKERLKVQKMALETLVQSVPQVKRQHAEEEYNKSVALLHHLDEAFKFLEKH